MFATTLTRSSNGHIRRALILTLATLLLFTALAIVPGSTLTPEVQAQVPVYEWAGNKVDTHNAWDPDTSAWVPGHPTGYTEGETAPMRVELIAGVGDRLKFDACLDLGNGPYAFTTIEPWNLSYSPPNTPTSGPDHGFSGWGLIIESTEFLGINGGECKGGDQSWEVRFLMTEASGAVVYGAHIAAPGDTSDSGASVGSGEGASHINGVFHAHVGMIGGGDKTVNFDGKEIIPIEDGRITIRKQTIPEMNVPFTFAGNELHGSITDFDLAGDELDAVVPPGSYTSTEVPQDGWELTDISCVGGQTIIDLDNGRVTFVVTGSAEILCTFTNTKLPSLKLVKNVVSTGGGAAVSGDWQLTAAEGVQTPVIAERGDYPLFTVVDPDVVYTLTETPLDPFDPVTDGYESDAAWVCNGGVTTANTVKLAAGEEVTCEITNTFGQPTLTLIKKVINLGVGPAVPDDWQLTANDGTSDVIDVAGSSHSGTPVEAGVVYTLAETSNDTGKTADYTVGTPPWACTGGQMNEAGTTIELGAGDDVLCFIANTFQPGPAIDIEKFTNGHNADAKTGPMLAIGSTVTWKYVVKNTGNIALSGVEVTDDILGHVCSMGDLAIGATKTCTETGTAVLGQYSNEGTVTGTYPGLQDTISEVRPTVTDMDPSHYYGYRPHIDKPSISVVKTGALGLGDDGIANPGDVITYEFTVLNDGNVPLTNIDVADLDLGGINVSCPESSLAVGKSMVCTADYPITQDDVDSGTVHNCALATGKDRAGKEFTDEDCFDTNIPRKPAIAVVKIVTPDTLQVDEATPVDWFIEVTNTGNITLHDVALTDALLAACDKAVGTLAVGVTATQTCTSTHTPNNLAWTFTNVVVATGIGSDGTTVTATANASLAPVDVAGTGQIGDTVWLDKDKDGVQDADEPGINGAKVVLKDADGTVIATAITAKGPWDGWYKFVGLDAGTYTATLDMSTVSGALTTAGAFTIDLADGEEYLLADFGVAEVLPVTGSDTEGLVLLAMGLLLLGGLAVLATRKRREEN